MLSHCRKYQPCPVLIVWGVGSAAEEVDLANIFPNIHHATDTADSEISNAMHCGTWTMNIHLQICKADILQKVLYISRQFSIWHSILIY